MVPSLKFSVCIYIYIYFIILNIKSAATGFSYNGETKDNKPKWDGVLAVDPIGEIT